MPFNVSEPGLRHCGVVGVESSRIMLRQIGPFGIGPYRRLVACLHIPAFSVPRGSGRDRTESYGARSSHSSGSLNPKDSKDSNAF